MVDKKVANLRWHERFSYSIVSCTEVFFYKLGCYVARNPKKIIAISWFIVIASALGLIKFHHEKNPVKLWVPQKSEFVRDTDWLLKTFQNGFRPEEVIFKANDILTPEALLEMLQVHKRLESAQTPNGVMLQDVCFKIPRMDLSTEVFFGSYKNKVNNITLDADVDPSLEMNSASYCKIVEMLDEECYVRSILDLWEFSERRIKRLTKDSILEKINKYEEHPMLGNLKNYHELLGGIERNESGYIISAQTAQTFYHVYVNFSAIDIEKTGNNAGTADFSSEEGLEWEEEFSNVLANFSKYARNFKVFYMSARSFGDISSDSMFSDFDKLFIGSVIMVVYVIFVISKVNWIEMRVILGCVGLLSVGMAFVVGCGICALCGVSFGPVHTSMPFLLMGLGVDDMFVLVACWEKLTPEQKKQPMHEKIGIMLKYAGVSITVTTATDVLAFIVGATTILPCLQSYCIYAAVCVFMTYIFVATFFTACFTLDQKRLEQNRNGALPWIIHDESVKTECSQRDLSGTIFEAVYTNVILTWPGKLFVIFFTIVCLGFSIESALRLEQKFDPSWFIPSTSYLHKYFIERDIYYPTQGFEAGLYIGHVNYTQEIPKIRNMVNTLENDTAIANSIISWVNPFYRYVKKNFHKDIYSGNLTENEFNLYLSKFLFSPKGARHQASFRFRKQLECGIPASDILLSVIKFRFNVFSGPSQHLPAMRKSMAIAKTANLTTGEHFATTWSKIFATWLSDEVIEVEVLRNMQLALISVMACTVLLIANFQICFWIFLCVLLTMINVMGFMQRWGLTIDVATCIALQLAIGLCVDYASHIGHTFLTVNGSKHERAIKTVKTIGAAVLYGGISTFVGVVMLSFSDAYSFKTFFKIFMLVVLFGQFYGVVLLPVILSWIGPKPYYSHTLIKQNDNAMCNMVV